MAVDQYLDSRGPDRRFYKMRILAQDPSVLDEDGTPLVADVDVPADRIEDGPRSHRIRVIDYDASEGRYRAPSVAAEEVEHRNTVLAGWDYLDRFAAKKYTRSFISSTGDEARRFRCQNVYAIVSRTLAAFEMALGRRVPWGFGSHELYVVPHAFADANAYYSREDRALFFGYVPGSGDRRTHTALAHDIVAHETAHALLDGLRSGFLYPGLPDQTAFHEGFADVVALLSILSSTEMIEDLLGKPDAFGRISVLGLDRAALADNSLFKVGKELAEAMMATRDTALRQSVLIPPGTAWRSAVEFEEPHRRGEVLVAAVMQTLLTIWLGRLEDLKHGRARVSRRIVAEEGAKSAGHLLNMCIRAIDYLPTTEFEFEDFVTAVLAADKQAAPDDGRGYRSSLRDGFGAFGIESEGSYLSDLTREASMPIYANINFGEMQSQGDEIFRFIWANKSLLRLDLRFHLEVDTVNSSVRVGPDGLVIREIVATYTQHLSGPASELARISGDVLRIPSLLDPFVEIAIRGGGSLIFDQFGKLKFHHAKRIDDWTRQNRRLKYLVANRLRDTAGRVGFSYGASKGQTFADLHGPATRRNESW